jgi:glycosyltransferase involved in cell wall biosynthesis/protein-L-isoaspartate O-methyltransferase
MSQQFMLLESNPEIGLKDGIYQDISEPFRDSLMPTELSEAVLDVFAKADDKSLFSLDIEALAVTDQLMSALTSDRFRFLQNFNLSRVNTVLDIAEDFGGLAHFMADNVGQIESLKIDSNLAKISAKRCANKHNVCHISADLEKLVFRPNHYDLIVIGQLELLQLTQTSLKALLNKLQASLSQHGVLVINAINSQRLTKWFDANSANQQSVDFSDLYITHIGSEKVIELNRKQLRDHVLDCNFAAVDIYAGFSNGEQNQALFSEDYLTASVNSLNHFYQLGSISNPRINEYLVYKRLLDEKQNLVDYAKSFVLLAGASSTAVRQLYDDDFCHFPNRQKKPRCQLITSRTRSAQKVKRQAAYPNLGTQASLLTQATQPQPYYKGSILADDWLSAVLKQDHRCFEDLLQEYNDWLSSAELGKSISRKVFEIVPSKIVLNQRGGQRGYQLIGALRSLDNKLKGPFGPEFLLFRALYWFIQENRAVVSHYALNNDIYTTGMFIVEYMPSVFQVDELEKFAQLEQHIQQQLYQTSLNSAISQALSESFSQSSSKPSSVSCDAPTSELQQRTIDSQNTALVGQSHRVKQLRIDNRHQTQRISDILEHRADLVEQSKQQQQSSDDLVAKLRAEIDHLHERLHAQHVRNDELHGYLLMRPTTRAKRVARRTVNRLTGKPLIDPSPKLPSQEVLEEVVESPLPRGELIGQNTEDYQLWISENTLDQAGIEAAKVDIESMPIKPLFSILVPIYNTDPEYLLPMIESVQNQIYPHWQLCLVDDCSPKSYLKRILEHEALQDERISIQLNDVNQGISVTTNDALAMARGDYIALLDHDDEISIDALYENAKVINATPDVGLIYSDEDKLDMQGKRLEAYFKPDYSPDLLHTNNYICHFTVIKKSIADQLGGFREGLDGSQDHDIIIRSAAAAERIVHIPKILYHWRKIPGSTAVTYDSKSYAWEAGRKAVEDQLKKEESGVRVEFGSLKGTYRVFRQIKGQPLVSIVIPFKDKPELLDSCLNSILNRSSYKNIEIIGVSNNSEQALTFERMKHYAEADPRIRFVEKNVPFNFSAICNYGVTQATGEYIVLLNNDIEIISPDWIERLLEHAQRDNIGAVGGKLLFADGCIQHAGVVAGMVGAAGHPHKFFPDNHIGYHGRLHMVYNVSAVTGAMLMVKKSKYQEVGGLDEQHLAVAYNDIDLCLKLLDKGYLNVFTPHAKATHYESISRGYEDTDEKVQRLLKEQNHFLTTWADFLQAGDPYYNPNLSLKNERFSLNFKD